MTRLALLPTGLWLLGLILAMPRPASAAEGDLVVRAGTVHTMTGEPLRPGAVRISDGRIVEVAETIEPPEGASVLDLGEDGALMPGLVDPDFRGGVEGPASEFTREVTPRFRLLPAVDPEARAFAEALAGGTTTAAILPDSENVVPGLACVVKTSGGVVLDPDGALVIAVNSDPTDRNRSRTRPDSIYVRQPTNRMGVVAILRDAFARASRLEPGSASADPRLLPLREAVDGERAVLGLSRTEFDLLTLLRLAEEFGVSPVIVGGQEAYKVADAIAEAEVPVVLGPLRLDGAYGPERTELAWNVAGLLHEHGVAVSLSGGNLLEQARFASRLGLPRQASLESITIEPARRLGVDDRVGAISAGRDADLVALDGDPLQFTTAVRWVMVDGVLRFPAGPED